jgi:hypothetical protein
MGCGGKWKCGAQRNCGMSGIGRGMRVRGGCEVAGDKVEAGGHGGGMRWVLMLFVVLAAVMGGEAGAVVVVVMEEEAARRECGDQTTWGGSYRADGHRAAEARTNNERHRARCLPKAAREAASGLVNQAAFAAGRSKEAEATGLHDEGCRNRDMETGTFISRDSSLFGEGASRGLDHVIRGTGNFGTGFFSPRMRFLCFRQNECV